MVKRFQGRGYDKELFQIGSIGLLNALKIFTFKEMRFTYAVPLIMGEIKILRDDGIVKVLLKPSKEFYKNSTEKECHQKLYE